MSQTLTTEEIRKAGQIGSQVARQRGYKVSGTAVLGRVPTSQCAVIVVVAAVGSAWVHVVLEIVQKEAGRFLHTLDVHVGSRDADDCSVCDEYHTYELYYEVVEEDEEHQCEGGTYWDDDGKGGYDPCTRFDTEWYESGFLLAGSAGWFCPHHLAQAYQEDLAAVRRARERMEQRGVT